MLFSCCHYCYSCCCYHTTARERPRRPYRVDSCRTYALRVDSRAASAAPLRVALRATPLLSMKERNFAAAIAETFTLPPTDAATPAWLCMTLLFARVRCRRPPPPVVAARHRRRRYRHVTLSYWLLFRSSAVIEHRLNAPLFIIAAAAPR